MYYLFEKYYRPITVQCYIADCVGWVPRVTFEQIGIMNKLDLTNMLLEWNLFVWRGFTVDPKWLDSPINVFTGLQLKFSAENNN